MQPGKVRIYGPKLRGRKWRLQYVYYDARGERTFEYTTHATRAEAEAIAAASRDEAQGVTVRRAVDDWLDHKRASGCVQNTLDNYEFRLYRLLNLPANDTRPIRWVGGRGKELYLASVRGAADTHINGLNVGRMWGRWLVEEKLLRVNPFADVKKLGRRRKGSGKERLTVNESRVLEAHCFANAGSQDCVLTYGYLMLGKRASELARLTVRDLDDDGWLVRIGEAKSEASVGTVPVPERLRDMLLSLAKGRGLDAPLFTKLDGSRMTRFVARDRVKAVLKAAGVTVLPPQALRRTFTDNASRQGVALRTIAEMTGHTSTAVTTRSYMSPEQRQATAVERNLRVLVGGKR